MSLKIPIRILNFVPEGEGYAAIMSSDHGKPSEKPSDDVAGSAQAATAEGEAFDDETTIPDGPDAEPPPEELTPPPHAVAELAAACVRFVATRYGVMLDFEPDTLSLVDQWVRDARVEIAVKPQTIDLVQGAAGAYLGEVVRRAFGGAWFAEGEQDGWRVDLSRVFLTFNPIGMVREALLLEPQEGWHAHLETDPAERDDLERRLEALPEVPDDEYFAPTTRFDVVHIAYEALRSRLRESGLADVRFGPEDYKR
jgi:hypothetical protein